MALEMDAVAAEAREVSGWTRTSWPPIFLLAPAVLVAAAIMLPIIYVVGRTFGAGYFENLALRSLSTTANLLTRLPQS